MVYSTGLLTCSTPGIPLTDSFANLVKISTKRYVSVLLRVLLFHP